MENKPSWVVSTEYYGTNLLAHLTNEEQAVMSIQYRVLKYYGTNELAH